MKENESCFQDLLACLSTQSQDELQALITATESFKGLYIELLVRETFSLSFFRIIACFSGLDSQRYK